MRKSSKIQVPAAIGNQGNISRARDARGRRWSGGRRITAFTRAAIRVRRAGGISIIRKTDFLDIPATAIEAQADALAAPDEINRQFSHRRRIIPVLQRHAAASFAAVFDQLLHLEQQQIPMHACGRYILPLEEGAEIAMDDEGEDGMFLACNLLPCYVGDLRVFGEECHVVAEDVHDVGARGAEAAKGAAHAIYAVFFGGVSGEGNIGEGVACLGICGAEGMGEVEGEARVTGVGGDGVGG